MFKYLFVFAFIFTIHIATFAQVKEFNLALNSANQGNFQTALKYFQKSLHQNPSEKHSSQIYYNIGVCFYRLNQPQNAVVEFEKALRLKNNYEKAFYALGMAQTDLQNWKEAEKAFRQSLEISNGRNGETWFDLAFVLIAQNDFESAITAFQNAIKYGSIASLDSKRNVEVLTNFLNSKDNPPLAKLLKKEVR